MLSHEITLAYLQTELLFTVGASFLALILAMSAYLIWVQFKLPATQLLWNRLYRFTLLLCMALALLTLIQLSILWPRLWSQTSTLRPLLLISIIIPILYMLYLRPFLSTTTCHLHWIYKVGYSLNFLLILIVSDLSLAIIAQFNPTVIGIWHWQYLFYTILLCGYGCLPLGIMLYAIHKPSFFLLFGIGILTFLGSFLIPHLQPWSPTIKESNPNLYTVFVTAMIWAMLIYVIQIIRPRTDLSAYMKPLLIILPATWVALFSSLLLEFNWPTGMAFQEHGTTYMGISLGGLSILLCGVVMVYIQQSSHLLRHIETMVVAPPVDYIAPIPDSHTTTTQEEKTDVR